MTENGGRRRPRVLSPETKWEIFLQVTSREITQADAARKWHVDVSTIIGIRRTVKDAALAALSARPGRPTTERNWELERGAWRAGAVDRGSQGAGDRAGVAAGKTRLDLSGPLPARVPGETKEAVLKLIDEAVAAGAPHAWACRLLGVPDDRVHRWRHRLRKVGTLEDRAPGGVALHAVRPAEIEAILASPRSGARSTAPTASSPITGPTSGGCGCRRPRSAVFWLLTGSCCPNHRPVTRRRRGLPKPGDAALVQGAPQPQPAHPPHLEADVPPRRPLAATRPHPASLPTRALRRPHPRQEPSAVVPHAGICAGAARKGGPYRDSRSNSGCGRRCPFRIMHGTVAVVEGLSWPSWSAAGPPLVPTFGSCGDYRGPSCHRRSNSKG